MKNIQVIDGAESTVYAIFSATDEEFALIARTARHRKRVLNAAFKALWGRRIAKRDAMGIHGILFYDLDQKKKYYPTRRDEEAVHPDGSRLR